MDSSRAVMLRISAGSTGIVSSNDDDSVPIPLSMRVWRRDRYPPVVKGRFRERTTVGWEETAEWMAVTRARSASQRGAGADSSTPNPGKPFGTRSPLYRCWPHRLSTSGGNDAGVLRKLGPQKPKAPPVAILFLRWSSAAPAVSHSRRAQRLPRGRASGGERPKRG